jgi:hypothetical protein
MSSSRATPTTVSATPWRRRVMIGGSIGAAV